MHSPKSNFIRNLNLQVVYRFQGMKQMIPPFPLGYSFECVR